MTEDFSANAQQVIDEYGKLIQEQATVRASVAVMRTLSANVTQLVGAVTEIQEAMEDVDLSLVGCQVSPNVFDKYADPLDFPRILFQLSPFARRAAVDHNGKDTSWQGFNSNGLEGGRFSPDGFGNESARSAQNGSGAHEQCNHEHHEHHRCGVGRVIRQQKILEFTYCRMMLSIIRERSESAVPVSLRHN
jgi:hypothetical protein